MSQMKLGPVFLWMLGGCSGSAFDTGSTDDRGDESSSSHTAQEGNWTLAPASVVQDECSVGDQLASQNEEPMMVSQVEGGLEIEFEGMEPWTCSQSANDLTCNEVVTETDYNENGIDALILETLSLDGILTSSVKMEMRLTLSYSCEGADCQALITADGLDIPCSTELTSIATAD